MKSRIFALLIVICLMFSVFTGCSNNNTAESTKDQQETETSSAGTDNASPAYAAELLTKDVSEIVEMMGGVFNYKQDANGFYDKVFAEGESNHGFYIYNFDVFPGMLFYIGDNAESEFGVLKYDMSESEALDKMAENIRGGMFIELDEIFLFDSAKLDDRISADMDYTKLTEACGYLETLQYYGDFQRQFISAYNSDIYLLEIYYESPKFSGKEFNGLITEEEMRAENPRIAYVSIAPTPAGGWQKAYAKYVRERLGNDDDWSGYLVKVNTDSFPEMIVEFHDGGKTPMKLLHIDPANSVHEEEIGTASGERFFVCGDKYMLLSSREAEMTTIDAYYLDDMGVMTEGFNYMFTVKYTGEADFRELIDAYRDDKEIKVKTCYGKDGKEISTEEFIGILKDVVDFTGECYYSDGLYPFKYYNAKAFIMSYQSY